MELCVIGFAGTAPRCGGWGPEVSALQASQLGRRSGGRQLRGWQPGCAYSTWRPGANTSQCQKLPLSMRQILGGQWVRDSGWEKQTSNRSAGVVQLRKPKTGECGEKQKEKESKNCSDPEKLVFLSYPWQSATPPLRHSATPPLHRHRSSGRPACTGHTSPQLSWNRECMSFS